jgi:hypothetical protein
MRFDWSKAGIAGALILSAGTAFAQMGPPPGGAPSQDPYKLPGGDTGNNDRASNMARDEQIYKGTRDAADRATASRIRAVPAKASDIIVGGEVRDSKGILVGSIESVDPAGAVVTTGTGRVMVPLEAFGKNKKGLLLGVTKSEFDSMVASATTQPAG